MLKYLKDLTWTPMGVAYRLAEEQDIQDIRNLWNENTDWGELTEETLRERVFDDPLEPVLLLAHDEDTRKLVGQFLFVPSLLWIRGELKRAFRPAAPIVAKGWRDFGINPLNHLALKMYREGCGRLKAQGAALIYMVPSATWSRLFKMFPEYNVGKFPLYKLPLDEREPRLPADASFQEIGVFDSRIEHLWEKFRGLHEICVVRSPSVLPIKFRIPNLKIVSVEARGEVIGLLAMMKKGKQWLINDMMFEDTEDSLTMLAEVALHYGREYNRKSEEKLEKVSLLVTEKMKPALVKAGFQKDSYNFPLVVQSLSKDNAALGDLSPEHWFVSAGD